MKRTGSGDYHTNRNKLPRTGVFIRHGGWVYSLIPHRLLGLSEHFLLVLSLTLTIQWMRVTTMYNIIYVPHSIYNDIHSFITLLQTYNYINTSHSFHSTTSINKQRYFDHFNQLHKWQYICCMSVFICIMVIV